MKLVHGLNATPELGLSVLHEFFGVLRNIFCRRGHKVQVAHEGAVGGRAGVVAG
jgi:hypothetical protein